MGYKYQMHAHTSPASACAQIEIDELLLKVKQGGYAGCVLTNHFRNGNTGLSRALDFKEFVRQYAADYEKGLKTAREYDLDLIFGVEEYVGEGLEILCYGVTPEMLLSHPELERADAKLWHDTLKPCGVICVQAHPFRDRAYIPKPKLLNPNDIDGIEVYNCANQQTENTLALECAKKHPEFILVSGADFHGWGSPCHGGIETENRIKNEKELAAVLKSGKYKLIY